jgi:hypothetical protein
MIGINGLRLNVGVHTLTNGLKFCSVCFLPDFLLISFSCEEVFNLLYILEYKAGNPGFLQPSFLYGV